MAMSSRHVLMVVALLGALCAAQVAGIKCLPWCQNPCTTLNGNLTRARRTLPQETLRTSSAMVIHSSLCPRFQMSAAFVILHMYVIHKHPGST